MNIEAVFVRVRRQVFARFRRATRRREWSGGSIWTSFGENFGD